MPTADQLVKSFTDALQNAETTGDVKPLAELFANDAQLSSISLRKPHVGVQGAVEFWNQYLKIFKSIKSEFTHLHASGDLAALEWKSEGVLPSGLPISYLGVSILEFENGKIARFRTYYDSAAFLPDGAKLLGRDI